MLYHGMDTLGMKPKGLNLCELGNLYVADDMIDFLKEKKVPKYKTAKDVFTYLGFNDTSIDLNEKDGAIGIDLSKPIRDEKLIGKFDILINGGTTEHVENQYMCWKNVHKLCKENGLVISAVPLQGNMKNHSPWRYSKRFFKNLIKRNNYSLIGMSIIGLKQEKGYDCIYVSFEKTDSKFINRNTFVNIWNKTINKKVDIKEWL